MESKRPGFVRKIAIPLERTKCLGPSVAKIGGILIDELDLDVSPPAPEHSVDLHDVCTTIADLEGKPRHGLLTAVGQRWKR